MGEVEPLFAGVFLGTSPCQLCIQPTYEYRGSGLVVGSGLDDHCKVGVAGWMVGVKINRGSRKY